MTEGLTVEYPRARIIGTLTCESALHVGDGGLVPFTERGGRARGKEGLYNTICIDIDGSCYLPASTLRGFLRAASCGEPALAERLFGQANAKRSGKVRVYDAYRDEARSGTEATMPYWHSVRGTSVRHGIAIDPITGVVERHKLFRHELVPAGTRFRLSLEADRISHGDLQVLLRLLYRWDGSEAAAIGKGKGKGQGRLRWDLERVTVLTEKMLGAWLRSDAPLDDGFFERIAAPQRPAGAETRFVFRIRPTAPLLPNEIGFVTAKRHADDHPPGLEFSRLADGRPCIPAATLRGMVRARARRILMTLVHGRVNAELASRLVDDLIDRLFGSIESRGVLWFRDAEALVPGSAHPQFFNAIDRFTGGGASEKLYNVNAVACDELRFTASLDPTVAMPTDDWWKGLLVLVLRDAMEGDLAIGWGKARGYGAFRLGITTESGMALDSWAACMQELRRRGDPDGWVPALRDEIFKRCSASIQNQREMHAENPT